MRRRNVQWILSHFFVSLSLSLSLCDPHFFLFCLFSRPAVRFIPSSLIVVVIDRRLLISCRLFVFLLGYAHRCRSDFSLSSLSSLLCSALLVGFSFTLPYPPMVVGRVSLLSHDWHLPISFLFSLLLFLPTLSLASFFFVFIRVLVSPYLILRW